MQFDGRVLLRIDFLITHMLGLSLNQFDWSFFMSSFVSFGSPEEQSILSEFAVKLKIPVEALGNVEKGLEILEKILVGSPVESIQPTLEGDLMLIAKELQEVFCRLSFLDASLVIQALQDEMKKMVENKIEELKSIIVRDQYLQALERNCKEILTEISPLRIAYFPSVVERFYHKALSKEYSSKEALVFALAKGVVRSMVKLPTVREIAENKELQEKAELDGELKAYMCAIIADAIGEKAGLALRETGIKPDHKAKEFIENRLLALAYPELEVGASLFTKVEALQSKGFLLAIAAAYPVINEKYEGILAEAMDHHLAIASLEIFAKETLYRFISLVEGVDLESEEIVSPCFLGIEELLRQIDESLRKGVALENLRAEFRKKVDLLLVLFHEIETSQMSFFSKGKFIKMAGEREASLSEVKSRLVEYTASEESITHQEAEIKEAFPGFLIGKEDWGTRLGEVERVPFPDGILEIAGGPCPITPGKKVWETHLLVLIPSVVNGIPLTINTLGSFIKSKGHFLDSESGYCSINQAIIKEYGDKPTGSSRFVLMTKDVLPESRNKSYVEQSDMVSSLVEIAGCSYEIPCVLVAAVGIYMNYLVSGMRLYGDSPLTYMRCKEEVLGYHAVVGGFALAGLDINHYAYDFGYSGIGALREF